MIRHAADLASISLRGLLLGGLRAASLLLLLTVVAPLGTSVPLFSVGIYFGLLTTGTLLVGCIIGLRRSEPHVDARVDKTIALLAMLFVTVSVGTCISAILHDMKTARHDAWRLGWATLGCGLGYLLAIGLQTLSDKVKKSSWGNSRVNPAWWPVSFFAGAVLFASLGHLMSVWSPILESRAAREQRERFVNGQTGTGWELERPASPTPALMNPTDKESLTGSVFDPAFPRKIVIGDDDLSYSVSWILSDGQDLKAAADLDERPRILYTNDLGWHFRVREERFVFSIVDDIATKDGMRMTVAHNGSRADYLRRAQ